MRHLGDPTATPALAVGAAGQREQVGQCRRRAVPPPGQLDGHRLRVADRAVGDTRAGVLARGRLRRHADRLPGGDDREPLVHAVDTPGAGRGGVRRPELLGGGPGPRIDGDRPAGEVVQRDRCAAGRGRAPSRRPRSAVPRRRARRRTVRRPRDGGARRRRPGPRADRPSGCSTGRRPVRRPRGRAPTAAGSASCAAPVPPRRTRRAAPTRRRRRRAPSPSSPRPLSGRGRGSGSRPAREPPPRRAAEDPRTERFLQAGDRPADRRLGDAESDAAWVKPPASTTARKARSWRTSTLFMRRAYRCMTVRHFPCE